MVYLPVPVWRGLSGRDADMPCACKNKGNAGLYNIEVTFADGTRKVYSSKPEARIAIAGSKRPGTMRQVLAKDNPVSK